MGKYWIVSLASVLRAEGLSVLEMSGWMTRSRSSGGFEQILGLAWHHTGSGGSEVNGETYGALNAADRPIGNAYLRRDGTYVVIAAGAANTQGRGGPVPTSKGTVPLNDGNRYMIAIEAHNNGVGEPWPTPQLDAYIRGSYAICKAYGLNPSTDIYTHAGYCQPSCPGRKIDPAGPTPAYPGLGGTSGAAMWSQSEARRLVATYKALTPPPSGIGTYVVQAGDSWWGISRAYGITVDQLVALNPPATSSTIIHPGDILNVPGSTAPQPPPPPPAEPKAPNGLTAAENRTAGAVAATPPSNPVIVNTLVHNNSPWLQQVLCSMNTLPVDGGEPIFPPGWVGEGRIGTGPAVYRMFGDGGKAALSYWQSKNGLTADGVYGPQTEARLRAVRGR